MSAAATAAMWVVLSEEERRRNDPDYEPLCSVGDLVDCPWTGPVLVIFLLAWSAAMIYMALS